MAFTTGNQKGEMNVTPLIDVLLVLLIIFMIITPTDSVGLRAVAPQPSDEQAPAAAVDPNVVVQIGEGLRINNEPVSLERLGERLMEIFARRAERVVFVQARAETEFQEVARVVDIAKGAAIDRVGLLAAER